MTVDRSWKLKYQEPFASNRRDLAKFIRYMRSDGKRELAELFVRRMKDGEQELVGIMYGKLCA